MPVPFRMQEYSCMRIRRIEEVPTVGMGGRSGAKGGERGGDKTRVLKNKTNYLFILRLKITL
jgi:hypothetical protein